MLEYRPVRGHIEVYKDEVFWFSADSIKEADEEFKEMEANMLANVISDRVEEDNGRPYISHEKFNGFYKPIGDVFKRVPWKLRGMFVWSYSPEAMVEELEKHPQTGSSIKREMMKGNEDGVKQELCNYIDKYGYDPYFKDYIWSVNWC